MDSACLVVSRTKNFSLKIHILAILWNASWSYMSYFEGAVAAARKSNESEVEHLQVAVFEDRRYYCSLSCYYLDKNSPYDS